MWAQPVCSKEAWAQNYHIPLYSPIPPFSSNNLTLLLTAIVLTPYFQYIFCILYFGASLRTEYVSPVTQAQEKDCYLGPAACWLVSDNWSSAVTTDHALARWLVRWGEVTPTPGEKQARPGISSFFSGPHNFLKDRFFVALQLDLFFSFLMIMSQYHIWLRLLTDSRPACWWQWHCLSLETQFRHVAMRLWLVRVTLIRPLIG